MADFCTKCASELGFDIDIDVEEIFNKCERGKWVHPFLCEECGLYGVGKTITGELEIYYYENCMDFKKGISELVPVVFKSIEEWKNSKSLLNDC